MMEQANHTATENAMNVVYKFLDNTATHSDEVIRFCASDMIPNALLDASYLSEGKAKS